MSCARHTICFNPYSKVHRDVFRQGATNIFNGNTIGSRFATVRFTTIHFYDPCRVGPNTPDL